MILRKAQIEDYPNIISLIKESVFSSCSDDYTLLQLNAWIPKKVDLKRFSSSLSGCLNLVCVEGEDVVGFISTTTDGYINRLFTHSNYQGRGIATMLLERTEQWAKSMGLDFLFLDSSITAEKFYLNRGFHEIEKTVLQRDGVELNAILMKKNIV